MASHLEDDDIQTIWRGVAPTPSIDAPGGHGVDDPPPTDAPGGHAVDDPVIG